MAHNGHDHQEGGHFVVPFHILRNVAAGLLVLTLLTVVTARMHLGWAAAPIAFLIASIKAYMVMAYFMGLKYDSRMNRWIFATGFFFLAVLYTFCASDIWTRIQQFNTL
jgi:cytochrome c oxidase subunit 4